MTNPMAAGVGPDDPFDLCGITIEEKYRVVSLVGSGGFGVVYRGVHTGFGEPIAVKCLKINKALSDGEREDLLTKLQDEGRVLHRLSKLSSGIVQALDVGAMTSPNGQWVPYLVLEWLEGETLATYMGRRLEKGPGPLSLLEALELLEPAARALEVAHRQKVAHRDVKPENLYLADVAGERTLKVLDFGIAKVLASHVAFTAAPAATQHQASAFTPSYGAPEQFNKKRGATGPWTDVFALALIMVELVSGERALAGDDATQLYIAAADPASRPTLRYHGVETSDAVEDVLDKALAIDPAERYQDVGAFWTALRAAAKAPMRKTPSPDVSSTQEYVSNNPIGLDPSDLSDQPPKATRLDRPKPAADKPAADRATPKSAKSAQPSAQAPKAAKPAAKPVDDDEADAGADDVEHSPAPPAKPREGVAVVRRHAKAASRGETATRPPAVTAGPAPQASGRWMPIVVLLALAGAIVLYLQLRDIGQPGIEPLGPSTRLPSGKTGAPSGTSTAHAPLPAPSASDAGTPEPDASAADAGADAGPPHFPAPEGMVFIAPNAEAGVAKGFFIDVTEVTTTAYRECVSGGECAPRDDVVLTLEAAAALAIPGVDETTTAEELASAWGPRCNETSGQTDHPINCVKHGDATAYCRWKGGKRLPSAAEWKLAAVGNGARKFPWGDTPPECATACFALNGACVGSATTVATCAPGAHADKTPEGVVDLGGNVSEWVSDKGKADSRGVEWRGVLGGHFASEGDQLLSSRSAPPSTAFVTIGFRCARTLPDGFQP